MLDVCAEEDLDSDNDDLDLNNGLNVLSDYVSCIKCR